MKVFGRSALPLDQRLPLDAALEDAFVPLRALTASVGAARVRAAVRWSSPATPPLRGLALFTRISELSLAAAISAFLFVGAVGAAQAAPAGPDVSRNAAAAGEWILNGRLAFQRPISSQVSDHRDSGDGVASNAAIARRPPRDAAPYAIRDTEPFALRP